MWHLTTWWLMDNALQDLQVCSRAVAYARPFSYDDWRGNLIVIVRSRWKEWIDGNQDSG